MLESDGSFFKAAGCPAKRDLFFMALQQFSEARHVDLQVPGHQGDGGLQQF